MTTQATAGRRAAPHRRGRLTMVLAVALAAAAGVAAGQASAAPTRSCPDIVDSRWSESMFAIRATGTTCAVATALARRTGSFAHSREAPWRMRHRGFTCKGGWNWAATRGATASGAGAVRERSTGISYARWRCVRGAARVTFVRSVNYGG